jgi:uncharacterized protein (TIGR03067 family)
MSSFSTTLRCLALALVACSLASGCRNKSASSAGTAGSAGAGAAPSAGSLDGGWKAIAVETEGEQLPAKESADNPAVLQITGNRIALTVGTRTMSEGTVRVDDSQQPRAIDLEGITLSGAQAGRSFGTQGIYEVSGDTLRICFSSGGGARPKAFETHRGSGTTIITYRRVR